MVYEVSDRYPDYLCHHGILGQKWGVRRFQNRDGTLTAEGKLRYCSKSETDTFSQKLREYNGFSPAKSMQSYRGYPVRSEFAQLANSPQMIDIASRVRPYYTAMKELGRKAKIARDYGSSGEHARAEKRWLDAVNAYNTYTESLVKEFLGEHGDDTYDTLFVDFDSKKLSARKAPLVENGRNVVSAMLSIWNS